MNRKDIDDDEDSRRQIYIFNRMKQNYYCKLEHFGIFGGGRLDTEYL
jgi:hypothetical protein